MRSYNDMVLLRPREDMEKLWNSSTIITPDSALLSADQMVGYKNDHAAIAEVFRLPEDYCGEDIQVGDGVVLPLFSGSKVICVDGEPYLACKRQAIAAKVTDLGKPTEKLQSLNGYILTKRDREAFEKRMYGGLLLPDQFLDEGMPCDGGSNGIVRVVLERIVSSGTTYLNPTLHKPKQRVGDLALFNPLASCRFRRFQVIYRLTPNESVDITLED